MFFVRPELHIPTAQSTLRTISMFKKACIICSFRISRVYVYTRFHVPSVTSYETSRHTLVFDNNRLLAPKETYKLEDHHL